MVRCILHILPALALLLCSEAVSRAGAGPKSAGAVFAFSGIGLNWQQYASSEGAFHDISAEMDFYGVLSGESRSPGIRFSYIKNFIFASSERRDFRVDWYAGPGFTAGYVRDRGDAVYGIVAGICADIGVEFNFHVPVCLSIGLMPALAAHIVKKDGNLTMDLYSNGLLHLFSPKVGIRYNF